MTWEPGQPVTTAQDEAEWDAWRKARKLEQQRHRRATMRRIDYYPSKKALAIIEANTRPFEGGDFSSVIDAFVLAGKRKTFRNKEVP